MSRASPTARCADRSAPKPAPDMLTLALTRLQVSPTESLYVGDMTVDIETARGAGVAVWVVPTGSDAAEALRAAKPDRVLERIGEVPDLIERSPSARR